MTTICLSSIKGGTGKTSTAILLSKYLAKAGKRILNIDMDPQNSLSFYYLSGEESQEDRNIALAIHTGNLLDNIIHTDYENIHLIQSSFNLVNLRSLPDKQLSRMTNQLENFYDFLIIDTAPTWDNLVLNAINAADFIISPARYAQFDFKGAKFYRDQLFMETNKVDNWYILVNFFKDPRTDNPDNLTNQYIDMFTNEFSNILNIKVPNTELIKKYVDAGETISEAQNKKQLHESIGDLCSVFLDEDETIHVERF